MKSFNKIWLLVAGAFILSIALTGKRRTERKPAAKPEPPKPKPEPAARELNRMTVTVWLAVSKLEKALTAESYLKEKAIGFARDVIPRLIDAGINIVSGPYGRGFRETADGYVISIDYQFTGYPPDPKLVELVLKKDKDIGNRIQKVMVATGSKRESTAKREIEDIKREAEQLDKDMEQTAKEIEDLARRAKAQGF